MLKVKDLKDILENYDDDDDIAIQGEDEELYDCSVDDVVVMFEGKNIRVLMFARE